MKTNISPIVKLKNPYNEMMIIDLSNIEFIFMKNSEISGRYIEFTTTANKFKLDYNDPKSLENDFLDLYTKWQKWKDLINKPISFDL